LREDGLNVNDVISIPTTSSSFTYVIVDQKNGTRTCIHTPMERRDQIHSNQNINSSIEDCEQSITKLKAHSNSNKEDTDKIDSMKVCGEIELERSFHNFMLDDKVEIIHFDSRFTHSALQFLKRFLFKNNNEVEDMSCERKLKKNNKPLIVMDIEKMKNGLIPELMEFGDVIISNDLCMKDWFSNFSYYDKSTYKSSSKMTTHEIGSCFMDCHPNCHFLILTKGKEGFIAFLRRSSDILINHPTTTKICDRNEMFSRIVDKLPLIQPLVSIQHDPSSSCFIIEGNSIQPPPQFLPSSNGDDKLKSGNVVDSTGAGDAFIGGLILSFLNQSYFSSTSKVQDNLKNQPILDQNDKLLNKDEHLIFQQLLFSTLVASRNVCFQTARGGMGSLEELEEYLDLIIAEKQQPQK